MATSIMARVIAGHRNIRLLTVFTRQSTVQCFHHQCHKLTNSWKGGRTGSLVFRFDRLKQASSQRLIFDQVRLINIAGEESLEAARREQSKRHRRQRGNEDEPPRSSKRRSALAYMFALLPVATFCLGTWQIYRLQWKLDLIAKLENLVKNEAVDFPEDLTGLQEQEYLKVRLSGYFDTNAEPVFIFPRPVLQEHSKSDKPGSGLFSASNSRVIGALMVVPFVVTDNRLVEAYHQLLVDSGREEILSDKKQFRILVNVGWVPRETMEKVNRSIGGSLKAASNSNGNGSSQEIELVGVIRKTEKREPFAQKKDTGHGYCSRRDIVKISDQLDTTPIWLDAHQSYPILLSSYPETINPVGSQTRVNLRNEHLSYIITWYSLTVILSYLWYKKIFKRRL